MPARPARRARSGEVRVPAVPAAVAQEWIALNPGVSATDEPEPRPHSPRFYGRWSAGLLAASIVLALVLGNNGREDFVLLWMLVPALFVAALVTAYRIAPRTGPS